MLIRADSSVNLDRSLISSETSGSGKGGDLEIETSLLYVNNDSSLRASTRGPGNAGNIFGLEERAAILNNSANDIDASSGFGLDGNVTIQSPDLDPNQGTGELPEELATAAPSQSCQASGGGSRSSFINTGRGGLTQSPDQPLSGERVLDDIYPAGHTLASTDSPTYSFDPPPPPGQIVEARGWMINDRGEVVLVAAAPDISARNVCLKH